MAVPGAMLSGSLRMLATKSVTETKNTFVELQEDFDSSDDSVSPTVETPQARTLGSFLPDSYIRAPSQTKKQRKNIEKIAESWCAKCAMTTSHGRSCALHRAQECRRYPGKKRVKDGVMRSMQGIAVETPPEFFAELSWRATDAVCVGPSRTRTNLSCLQKVDRNP